MRLLAEPAAHPLTLKCALCMGSLVLSFIELLAIGVCQFSDGYSCTIALVWHSRPLLPSARVWRHVVHCPLVRHNRPLLPSARVWRHVVHCPLVRHSRPLLPSARVWRHVVHCPLVRHSRPLLPSARVWRHVVH